MISVRIPWKLVAGTVMVSLIVSAGASLPASAKQKQSSTDRPTKQGIKSDQGTDTPAPCISWVNPLVKPRIVLLCIHGLGLYSGSYQSFGLRMARRGIATYAIDVRGFGSWMKAQGHEQVDFNACLQDIKTTLESIHQANPGLPVFLLGESMGGAIALRAASMYPDLIDGLISSVPAGDRFRQKRTDLKVALNFLKGPNRQFDIGKSIVNQATQNDRLRQDWTDNPLDRMTLSPKELIQFQKFMNDNHDAANKVTSDPVLFVQGTEDRLVKPEGTWDLFNELSTKEKYFLAVPSEHLIFEEGQDKSATFDARASQLTSNWMYMMASPSGGKNKDQIAVAPPEPNDTELSAGIDKLVKGDYKEATAILEPLIKSEPSNAEAHYWLGMAYAKERRLRESREQMTLAMSLAKGTLQAEQANDFLLANSADAETPTTTEILPEAKSLTNGTPAVLAFYTTWSQQSAPIDNFFSQTKTMFGDKIKLLKIDVEDHANDALVKAFKIGPVPTVVYLSADGKVVSTTIGRTSFINFAKGIRDLLR